MKMITKKMKGMTMILLKITLKFYKKNLHKKIRKNKINSNQYIDIFLEFYMM